MPQPDALASQDSLTQYRGPMLAAARRVLRNEDDAHEVVQDAFLSAIRSWDAFRGDASLGSWLHRIAFNAALMRRRRVVRRRESGLEPEALERGHYEHATARATPAPASRPDELLERRELRAGVRAAIARLSPTYRAVLQLRDIEELDTEETAERLGISRNAVKIRLHRARQALRDVLPRELQML